jgi:predicted NBD/HSP70 family sugar kinase
VAAPRSPHEWGIGIDVGGTKIAAGAVELGSGTVAFRRETPTRPERAAAVLADIETLAETVAGELRRDGRDPVAIGIGVPELVDVEGRILSAHLLDWSAIPLSEGLQAIAPALIAADVRAAALAESKHGAGREFESFAYISIGSGISSTVVQDGVPLVGARGGALVLSSGSLGVPCPECSNWTEFVLEDYASGPALARRYAAATGRVVEGAELVIAAANEGEPTAVQIVDSAADALGSSLGWLVNVLDPEAIVGGGGLGLARGRFRERLIAATRSHIWNPGARGLPFVSAALGADAGLIGAALTAAAKATELMTTSERR